MNYSDLRKSAEAYVEDQLGVMRAHGREPDLNEDQIKGMVLAAESNFARVAGIKLSRDKQR